MVICIEVPARKSLRTIRVDLFAVCVVLYYVLYFLSVAFSEKEMGGSILVDELFAVILLPYAVRGFVRLTVKPDFLLFSLVVYFLFYLISTFVRISMVQVGMYPVEAALQGIVLELKPFVYALGVFDIFCYKKCRTIDSIITSITKALVFLALVNALFAVGDVLRGQSESILGVPLLTGFFGFVPSGLFTHKYGSAVLTMVGSIAALVLSQRRYGMRYLWVAGFLLVVLVLHSAMKELLGSLLAFFLFLFLNKNISKVNLLTVAIKRLIAIVMLIVCVAGLYQVISDAVVSRYKHYIASDSVRVMMHNVAVDIARDNFPLGTGAGTYGSAPSRTVYYSDIYHQYGLSKFYGASPDNSSYLMDTWWPKILGESGFFGMFAYLAFWGGGFVWMIRAFIFRRDSTSFFMISLATAIMVSSLAAAVFTSDVYMPLIGLVWGWAMAERRLTVTRYRQFVRGKKIAC